MGVYLGMVLCIHGTFSPAWSMFPWLAPTPLPAAITNEPKQSHSNLALSVFIPTIKLYSMTGILMLFTLPSLIIFTIHGRFAQQKRGSMSFARNRLPRLPVKALR